MKRQRNIRQFALRTFLGVIFIFGSVSLYAQPGMRGGFDRDQVVNNQMTLLKERLDLSQDQEAAIRPLVSAEMDSVISYRQRMTPGDQASRQEMFQAMTRLREQTDQKISGLLTKDQQQKFQALRQEQMERRRNRMGNMPGGQGRM